MNVMLVDDNKMFRKAFIEMLQWEEYQIHIIAEAYNGVHALELLQEISVDVIVTDMSMPEMNGIDLIKVLKTEKPDIQVIALSNFDEFDFVKEALKLGAKDYILKHELNVGILLDVFEEAKEDCSKPRYKLQSIETFVESDILLGKVLHKQCDVNEAKTIWEHFTGGVKVCNLYVTLIQPVERKKRNGMHAFETWFRNIVSYDEVLITTVQNFDQYLIISNLTNLVSEMKYNQQHRKFLENIRAEGKKTGVDFLLMTSEKVRGMEGIHTGYTQVIALKEAAMIQERKGIYFYPSDKRSLNEDETITLIDESFYSNELINNKEAFISEINRVFDYVNENPMPDKRVAKLIGEIASVIHYLAKVLKVKVTSFLENEEHVDQILNQDFFLVDKRKRVISMIESIYEKSNSYDKVQNRDVEQIISYLNKNYMKPIQLCDVAKEFGYSANYLSQLFKHETNTSFVEYLKKIRVHHAKKLISQGGYRTYEIAEKTGFQSASYFCTVFKEVVGHSPKEHKNRGGR